jgi:hypothetical protein
MVITQKVQNAVQQQPADFPLTGGPVPPRLPQGDFRGDDDISHDAVSFDGLLAVAVTQHVRRVIGPSVKSVEGSNPCNCHEKDRQKTLLFAEAAQNGPAILRHRLAIELKSPLPV